MKRVVNFQEDDAESKDVKFVDLAEASKIKGRTTKRQKSNNDSSNSKGDRANIKAKRKEMLEFRKKLPIYSGTPILIRKCTIKNLNEF